MAAPQTQPRDNLQLEPVTIIGTPIQTDLDRAASRLDPLLNIEWDIVLQLSGIKFRIEDYVEEVTLPSVRVDTKQSYRQGIYVNHAKAESTGTLSLKLYETHKLVSYRFFRAWKNLVRDPQGNYGVPSSYKGTLYLYPQSPTKGEVVRFKCVGVFPISLPSYNFSSGQPERIVGEYEFSVDELIPLSVDSPTT